MLMTFAKIRSISPFFCQFSYTLKYKFKVLLFKIDQKWYYYWYFMIYHMQKDQVHYDEIK
jgi:hypothetical protein